MIPELKVPYLHEKQVERAANEAAVLVLAKALDVPPVAVRISAGHTHRNKTVEVAIPVDVLRPRIHALVSSKP